MVGRVTQADSMRESVIPEYNSPNTADIKSFFDRSISIENDINSRIESSGKKIGEDTPLHSRTIKFIFLEGLHTCCNFINRLFGFNKANKVSINNKTELNFVAENNNRANNYETVTINSSDSVLINDIKPEHKNHFIKDDNRPIFSDGKDISAFDIQQNDNRSSCYFLSMLMSYSNSSQKIKESLKNMITDLEDGRVKVSFSCEQYKIKFDVIVDKTQLATNSHDLVYSSNLSDTAWASLMEKAFHGLRIFLRASTKHYTEPPESNLSEDDIELIIDSIIQDMIGSTGKSENSLDYSNSRYSVTFLPAIPKCEPIAGLKQVDYPIQYKLQPNKNEPDNQYLKTIFENAKLGIPMNVNSKPKPTIIDAVKLGFQGMYSGHAMAVVGTATQTKPNGVVDGLMIIDPYARAQPSQDLIEAIKAGSASPINITNSKSCIKFVPLTELHKYFAECVIAPGGFELA